MNSITEIWKYLADKYGSQVALKDENTGYSLSFIELYEDINKVAQILNNLNLETDCKILLCVKPHPLWHVIDQAIMKSNFVSVLCDYTSSYSEVQHCIESIKCKVLFTDNIKLIETLSNEKILNHVFYVNTSNVAIKNNCKNVYNLIEKISEIEYKQIEEQEHLSNTVVSIMFSSGTTGKSKGAMFTHENLLLCFYDYEKISHAYKQTCVDILSLAHVAPRINEWGLLAKGNTIVYTEYIKYLETLKKYKPYYLMCVPKLLNMIIEKYRKERLKYSRFFQMLNTSAFAISYKYYKFKYSKKIVLKLIGYLLSLLNFICYKYCIKGIVNEFMNPKSSIIAFGAFTGEDVEGIISAMGLNLMVQYGMTEASVISYVSKKYKKAYSVGKINKNMDVIISDIETGKQLGYNKTGMIKVKGKQIMKGYYNNEKDTKEVFDSQGYLITGDLGYISTDNFLFFKGRYKNIIVLSNGENIDSIKIEQICMESNFVQQIVVFGQDKPYLTAIVVINKTYVNQWAKDKKIDINMQVGKDLLKKDILIDINNLIGKDKFFRWIEQIKDIFIIDVPFTIENGFMTRKYTIIRSKVYDKYKNVIEYMYR